MDTRQPDQPVSFTDREVYACPFPVYDRLREEQPVYRDPKSGHYILTRYDDVRKAMLNVAALSNNTGVIGDRWAPEANRLQGHSKHCRPYSFQPCTVSTCNHA